MSPVARFVLVLLLAVALFFGLALPVSHGWDWPAWSAWLVLPVVGLVSCLLLALVEKLAAADARWQRRRDDDDR